jgi:diguanylate cyclase (GGDEF)-like protein/PAS domain S-box-containing protein
VKLNLSDLVFCLLFLILLLLVIDKYKSDKERNIDYLFKNFDVLKLYHSNIVNEILSIESNKVNNFDSIVKLQKNQKIVFNKQLELIMTETYYKNIDFINLFDQYKLTDTRMAMEIESYKRIFSVTNNSLNYSEYLLDKVFSLLKSNMLNDQALILRTFFYLFSDIKSNDLESAKYNMELIFNKKNIFLSENKEISSLLHNLETHLEVVLTGRKSINRSLTLLLAYPYHEDIDNAYDILQKAHKNKKRTYYSYLSVITLLIILVSFAIFIMIYNSSNLVRKLSQDKVNLSTILSDSKESLIYANMQLKKEISDRKHLDNQLRDSAIFYNHCSDGVMICDENKKVVSINRAYTLITGIKAKGLIGNVPVIFSNDKLPPQVYNKISLAIKSEKKWEGEIYSLNADSSRSLKFISIICLQNQENVGRYIVIIRDIEERRRQEKLIHRQANYDPLTNLPNRNFFNEKASLVLANAAKRNTKFAALFIDLDNFKKINDSLGHTIGDELLVVMSNRLKSCIKEGDIVSRFGGDEFIILLDNTYNNSIIINVIERVLIALSTSVKYSENLLLHISGSVGVAVYPQHGTNLSVLIRNADTAMYGAKKKGKNSYCIFEEQMNIQIQNYLSIESKLISALDNNELYIEYQPIIDPKNNHIYGVEALVRWVHRDTYISPDEFIPIAEESGLITTIGEWIIRTSCDQLAKWNYILSPNLKMSINISPRQFTDVNFYLMLMKIIQETEVNSNNLNLEITENVFISGSNNNVTKVLGELSNQGISISLDDFGTGYSSLSYLKNFPVNILKIDRSFITHLNHDVYDQHLVKAIINLAKDLGIKVVAEGVESEEQLVKLSHFDCDYIQGYFYSRPLSPEGLEHLHNQHKFSTRLNS